MGNVVKAPGVVDEVVAIVVDFVVVVADGFRIVVVVKDGRAGADGRTRHGRTKSIKRKCRKSKTKIIFMLELWTGSPSYCHILL